MVVCTITRSILGDILPALSVIRTPVLDYFKFSYSQRPRDPPETMINGDHPPLAVVCNGSTRNRYARQATVSL
jgi:hypothetical protein